MRILSFLLIFVLSVGAFAREPLTLDDLLRKAREIHPLGLQTEELEKIDDLNREIINSSWLPDMDLNGRLSYQSDVTMFDIDMPGIDFPEPSNDQYSVNLELTQLIYDASLTKRKNQVREASHKVELQKVEVQVYQVLERINAHFFQHFLIQENIKQANLAINELQQKLLSVKSAVDNGVLNVSEQWAIEAGILKLEQKKGDLKISLDSNLEILEILTGENISELRMPGSININGDDNRPETRLFRLQRELFLSSANLTQAKRLPFISGFSRIGYGKPGLNMLNDEFDFFYIVGLNFSWKLWDWQKISNHRQIQQLNANMVDVQEQEFDRKLEIALEAVKSKIKQLQNALEKDTTVIGLFEQIAENAGSQLENGVITSSEYINHFNNLAQARINWQSRKIMIMQKKAEYNLLLGNYEF